MALTLGVNVLETDGKASPSIQAAATSVAAFVIRSQRGVPGAVRRVSSPGQFKDLFGDVVAGSFGAMAVQGFFDNGGAVAYITRVADAAAAKAATITLGAELNVTAGWRGTPDPGTWGDALDVRVLANPVVANAYDLVVRRNGVVVETWEKLDLNAPAAGPARPPAKTINDPVTGSRYITVTVPNAVVTNPAPGAVTALAGGADDALAGNALTTALASALHNFDAFDVQLVACPESTDAAVVTAGLTYCENRGDCVFIGATPPGIDVDAAVGVRPGLPGKQGVRRALLPVDSGARSRGRRVMMPPTGHVMGVYARIDFQRGIWKAPAGNEARVMSALGTERAISDIDHTTLVKNGSVDAIRFIPGAGHRRRQLANAQHESAVVVRERPSAVQLREDAH